MIVDHIWGLNWKWLSRWIKNTGALLVSAFVRQMIRRSQVWEQTFDLVHVDEIDVVGPSLCQSLRKKYGPVSCYVNDDPFGDRDGSKWRLFLKAVPEYSLVTVVRQPNIQEAYSYGANNVLRVYFSADRKVHKPVSMNESLAEKWRSEVVFVGTWFPERGPFMAKLVDQGVPLTIRGNNWGKADEWSYLEPYWEGPALRGKKYTKALQGAKICLGLLSHGNRDLHTQRSMEIPYIGSLFCAERTSEHLELYDDGSEAVYWDDASDCAAKCFELLNNTQQRQEIAERGRQRCIQNGHFNEEVMRTIIRELA
ncbi:hypothetical protein GGP79_001128 [Salinibacter ruber]|uniref:CgeB family protein n=1 Tax=Salinibacter ruber TaxID=146919 RepID=UPI002168A054|nr:hypothetical protein [Salinibacter ruber]